MSPRKTTISPTDRDKPQDKLEGKTNEKVLIWGWKRWADQTKLPLESRRVPFVDRVVNEIA